MLPLNEIVLLNKKAAEREMDKHERELPEWPEDADPDCESEMDRLPSVLPVGNEP